MIAKQYALALADYKAALQIPANMEEARGNVEGRNGEVSYWIGNAYEAMGDAEKAHFFWNKAASESTDHSASPSEGEGSPAAHNEARGRDSIGGLAAGVRVDQAALYYRAMALTKLGHEDRATTIYKQLVDAGARDSGTTAQLVADAHFIVGLGELGLKDRNRARQEFTLALKASPDHYAARTALSEMGP